MWPRVSGDMCELTLPNGYKCEAHYTRYLDQYVIFYQLERNNLLIIEWDCSFMPYGLPFTVSMGHFTEDCLYSSSPCLYS